MPHQHLSREFLRAYLERRRDPGDLAPLVIGHLHSLCPHCAAALEAYRQLLDEMRPEGPLTDLADAEEGLEDLEEEEEATLPSTVEGPAPTADPLARAEELLEEARARLPGRPQEALARSRAARRVLWEEPRAPDWEEAYARALAHEGDARRLLGQLAEADDSLATARFLLRASGEGSRLTTAEIDLMEGALLRDQGRPDEAAGLLRRAATAYQMTRRPVEAARALLALSLVQREAGEAAAGLAAVEEALGLLSAERHPRLCLQARYDLVHLLLAAGDVAAARQVVDESWPLRERFPDPPTQLRALWLEGNLLRAEGRGEAAEGALRAARDGFARHGNGCNAALAAIDLALLYLEDGRAAAVGELAEEMLSLRELPDVRREAAAALERFAAAARAGEASPDLVRELAAYLEAARHDPTLPFRPSS